MSAQRITDDVVRAVARDLRERYGFNDEDLRVLGAKLAAGLRGGLGQDVVDEVWRSSDLSGAEALALADEEKHAARE